MAQLSATQNASTANVVISTVGTTDWIHWIGTGGGSNTIRKSGGGSLISDITLVGGATASYTGSFDPSTMSWTGGTPTASGSDTGVLYMNITPGNGAGFSITVPADTNVGTLYLYLNNLSTDLQLTAVLSDGSATMSPQVPAQSWPGNDTNFVITFQAGAAGQTLTVSFLSTNGTTGQTPCWRGVALVVAAGGPTLTGTAITSGQGALTAGISKALTGTAITSGEGSLTAGITAALTGQVITSVQGVIAPPGAISLTGTRMTSGIGSVVAGIAAPYMRFMPLGDSITGGTGATASTGGWRKQFFDWYTGGYARGSLQDTNLTDQREQFHEGHGGYTSNSIAVNISGWLTQNPSDIILLHIGTNDWNNSLSTSTYASNVVSTINTIQSVNPSAVVYVAKIIYGNPSLANDAFVDTYRNAMASAVTGMPGVVIVDFAKMLVGNYSDSLHPNDSGYAIMAATWIAAIAGLSYSGGLPGQAVTSHQGTLAPGITAALTGQAITSGQGIMTLSAASVALTGQRMTMGQGTITAPSNAPPTTIYDWNTANAAIIGQMFRGGSFPHQI